MDNTLLIILAGFSIGYNIYQKNKIKSERLQKERDYKFYLEDEKRLRTENLKLSKEATKDEKEINSLKIELSEAHKIIENNKSTMDGREQDFIELEMRYEELKHEASENFKALVSEHKSLVESNSNLIKNFENIEKSHKKLEVDLYNLDWAYDELLKAFNSNALDLYFWNLLPKSDRETRRRFINKGQYRVHSLEDGRVAFEVI